MKLVIIGNHAAGLTAAEVLRRGDRSCRITVISNEDVPPYSRCLIPYIVSGEKRLEDILFKPPDFYQANSIDAMLGVEAVRVLTKEKAVMLAGGQKIPYDALIIACGGTPSLPRLPGVENKGIFCFRSLEEAQGIARYCDRVDTAVVLGGGLIGLKAAVALNQLGKNVKVMVGSPNVLSQIVAANEAEAFEEHLGRRGMEIMCRTNPAVILGQGKVEAVETTEGRKIPCQLVVIGKGVDANMGLVQGTDIGSEYGVLVDEHCRTNVPDVYAAGDVAQSQDDVRGQKWLNCLWPHAVEEGRVAAENILGAASSLRRRTSMNSFVIGELAMISCGLTGAREGVPGSEEISVKGPGPQDRKRFILKDNRLVGFVLVGNVAHAGVLTSLVTRGVDASEIKDRLVSGKYDFSTVLPLVRKNRAAFSEPEYDEVLSFF